MFEQTFVPGPVRTRRAWSVLLSFAMQLVVIGALVLLPLVVTERVPVAQFKHLLFAPSVPQAPAPAPPPHVQVVSTRIEPRPAPVFREPTRIPARAQAIIDPPEAFQAPAPSAGSGIGVVGAPPGTGGGGGDAVINSFIPQPRPPAAAAAPAPVKPREQPVAPVPVGGKVQEAKLTHKVIPVYPQIARTARVSGLVRLSAIIGADGAIRELQVMSGHPLLIAPAVEAVRQWRYRPTTLNGLPVEVITTIEVHFRFN